MSAFCSSGSEPLASRRERVRRTDEASSIERQCAVGMKEMSSDARSKGRRRVLEKRSSRVEAVEEVKAVVYDDVHKMREEKVSKPKSDATGGCCLETEFRS